MSLSPITTLTTLDTSLYNAQTTSAVTAAQTTTAPAPITGNTVFTALQKELADLIKALATGDLSQAKKLLAQIQKTLKTQPQSTASNSASSATPSAFDTLLGTISSALSSGSTSDALSALASYLVQSGNYSGNLIDTLA